MYAVVYLIHAKKQIVVPKRFIFGLSQERLDNYGKNRNVLFKIFCSERVSENGLMPNENFVPNFGLNINKSYPPDQDETCYLGQIKYFFRKYSVNLIFHSENG